MRVISLKNYCESTRVVIQLLHYSSKVSYANVPLLQSGDLYSADLNSCSTIPIRLAMQMFHTVVKVG
jgi:hypothetical protein